MPAEIAPTRESNKAGTSQFAAEAAERFTSSKTSPGTAKTLSNRAARDVPGGLGASAGGAGKGGGSSIGYNQNRSRPTDRTGKWQKPLPVSRATIEPARPRAHPGRTTGRRLCEQRHRLSACPHRI